MAFQAIPWGRQSITGEQIEADGSRLLNLYAVRAVLPQEAKAPVILHGAPGTEYANVGDPFAGLLWIDSSGWGEHLIGVTRNGNLVDMTLDDDRTAIASSIRHSYTIEPDEMPDGFTRLATNGRHVVFVSRRNVWAYDLGKPGGAGFIAVLAPTPTDNSATLPDQDWLDITWIDGYFILLARNGEFYHSVLAGLDFDQLDFALADNKPDPGVAIMDLNRQVYIFGTRSIEIWYNAGGADFAFQRNTSYVADFGCAARATVQKHDAAIFFLSSLGQVVAVSGHTFSIVSTETVQERIRLSDIDQARAFVYTEQGHRFYALTLLVNGEPENWTYDANTQLWHERGETGIVCAAESGANEIWVGRSGGMAARNGLYRLGRDFGHDSNNAGTTMPIYREAVTPQLHNRQARVRMASFEVDIPYRSGDDDAVATLHWWDSIPTAGSDRAGLRDANGNRVWRPVTGQPQRTRPLTSPRIRFNQLGSFRARNYRISFETVRPLDILLAYTDYDRDED